MKKSIIPALLLTILLMTSGLFAQFAGGTGTSTNPYQITTAAELNKVRNYLGSGIYFKLMNNIDLTSYLANGGAGYNNGAFWNPIGDDTHQFKGKFAGNNKKITGLKIDRATEYGVGLWGNIGNEAIVQNLDVEISSTGAIKGLASVGGLVGENFGVINNCYVKGTVSASAGTNGGLVGNNYGTITNSYTSGTVSSQQNGTTGGLVGVNSNGVIISCYSSADVSNTNYYCIGGLIGANSGMLTNCYATGTVNGNEYVGGLVGSGSGLGIKNSYATGSVSGTNKVGGLVGSNGQSGKGIKNCYATGSVDGNSDIGGLVGYNNGLITSSYAIGQVSGLDNYIGGLVGYHNAGTVTGSYWNKQTTGQTSSSGSADSFGKTTSQMKLQQTFVDWDFTNIWTISSNVNSGYPNLENATTAITNTVLPSATNLLTNYPNPFNPTTTISFSLQNKEQVNLSVYNNKGELVKTLINGIQPIGNHSVNFDGAGLNSGVYFYKLTTSEKSMVNKMILIK